MMSRKPQKLIWVKGFASSTRPLTTPTVKLTHHGRAHQIFCNFKPGVNLWWFISFSTLTGYGGGGLYRRRREPISHWQVQAPDAQLVQQNASRCAADRVEDQI